jgi:hypothetical protein
MPVRMKDGTDHRDADAGAFDFAAQAVEEAVQRMLAGGVGGAAGQRRKAGDAGDGDDEALAVRRSAPARRG